MLWVLTRERGIPAPAGKAVVGRLFSLDPRSAPAGLDASDQEGLFREVQDSIDRLPLSALGLVLRSKGLGL